jgi:hypothetical protein
LVVKKGSKILPTTSGAMPTPVSVTLRRTCGPGVTPGTLAANAPSSWTFSNAMLSVPPAGMASHAFTHRFIRI